MKSMKITFQNFGSIFSYEDADIFRLQRWGYFLAAAILAALSAATTYRLLDFPQYYSEPIVGNIAWSFSNKFHDYAVLFGFVGGFFFTLIALWVLSIRIAKNAGAEIEDQFHDFIVLLCTPAGVWFAGLQTTHNSSLSLLAFSGVLLLTAFIFALLLTLKHESFWQLNTLQFFSVLKAIFLALLAVGFAVAAISLGANRIAALLNAKYLINSKLFYQFELVILLVAVVSTVGFIFTSRSSNHLEYLLRKSILLLQIFFPAFFLLLVPTPWLMINYHLIIGYSLSWPAWAVVFLCIVAAYVDLYRRYNLYCSPFVKNPGNLFSIICIIGVLLFIKARMIPGPTIKQDDYHFGEMLVPWWSMVQQHMVPFWDYSPARGLMNYFPGAAASIFFDGKASSFSAVSPFLYLGVLFIALPVLKRSIGIGAATLALLFAPYINGISEIDILVTVFICLLCQGFLRWKPFSWIVAWLTLDVAILLYAPGQGALAILASAPLSLFMFYRAYREERIKIVKVLFVFSVLILTIGLVTPVGKMIWGAIRYGAEQSSINSIAHGISWNNSFGKTNSNPWLFEIMRASWLLTGIWAGVLILKMSANKFAAVRSAVLVYAIPILLLTLFFIIRAAGRIDEGTPRLEIASIWNLSLLLPLLLFATTKVRQHGNAVFIWLSLTGLILPYFTEGSFSRSYSNAFDTIPNPTTAVGFVNGSSIGLPEVGSAVMDPLHLARLSAIRKTLDKALDPKETYLDLTGRHAHYFYFNRHPPIETGSVYNLVGERQQLRAIASLRKEQPPIILLSADNLTHDGGPVSLRANLLYRYVMLMRDYKVVKIDNYVWLIRNDRVERIAGLNIKSITEVDDAPSNVIHDVFREKNLESIPASWGRSSASLESKMHHIREITKDIQITLNSVVQVGNSGFRVNGENPFVRFDISGWHLSGRNAGIVSFDFTCDKIGPSPKIEIYWASSENAESELTVVRLEGRNGHLIVPMDAAPAWLLAKNILSIRFDVQDQNSCSVFKIENVNFFQRHGIDLFTMTSG